MATSISQQRLLEKRKLNGLCINCGKSLDSEGIHCISCRKRINREVRETRHWYQDNGICPRCRKVSLMRGGKACPECNAEFANRTARIRERNREEYNEKQRMTHKNIYNIRKEQGICTRCGKRKAIPEKTKCGICLDKDAKAHRKCGISRNERPSYGLCYICGKPLDREGRICKKCAETMTANLPKDRDNANWRNDNKLIFRKEVL